MRLVHLWRRWYTAFTSLHITHPFIGLRVSHAIVMGLLIAFGIGSYIIISQGTLRYMDLEPVLSAAQQRVAAQRVTVGAALLLADPDPANAARQQAVMRRYLQVFASFHGLDILDPVDTPPNPTREHAASEAAHAAMSQAVYAIYHQPPYLLETTMRDYVSRAQIIIDLPPERLSQSDDQLRALIAAAQPLDAGLERLVEALQMEKREGVQALLNLELLIAIVLIGLIVIVSGVILWPLQKRVQAAAAALTESETRYRSLVASLTEGVLLYDKKGNLLTFNTSAERILGFSLADYVGKATDRPDLQFINEDGTPQVYHERPVLHTLRTGQPQHNVIFGMVRPGSETAWLSVNIQPIFKQGIIDGVVASVSDISISRQTMTELQRGRALMNVILDNSPDSIFLIDHQSQMLLVNRAEARMMGLDDPAAAVGKTVFDLHPPDRAALYYASEQAVMAAGEVVRDKLETLIDEDGSQRWFSATKVPLKDEHGKVAGMLGVSRDITERMLAERQQTALERERDKVEILANLMRDTSHEIRTPLSLMNVSLYLLRRTDDREKQLERITVIEDQVRYLTGLLDQMQNLAALDRAGDFALLESDLVLLVDDMIKQVTAQASTENKQIVVEHMSATVPIKLNARQMRFALRHLLENAFTFTPPGGTITVRTGLTPPHSVAYNGDATLHPSAAHNSSRVQGASAFIEVADTGQGIAPEHLPHIFDRFYKGDSARPIEKGGAGIGLSIVKRIVSIHQGVVTVRSVPGAGSTFCITLPLTIPPVPPAQPTPSTLAGMHNP